MRIEPLPIADVKRLVPVVHRDARGSFCETYSARALKAAGIDQTFVQDNQSVSLAKGVVRGLHFQAPPHAQAKLVRVVSGAILDVAVDLRRGSPTYGHHIAEILTAENWVQLFIPVGFAHGFCTLEANTTVAYKTSDYYASECDRGLLWNDPALGIDWPVTAQEARLSEKDQRQPLLSELAPDFAYGGRVEA